MFFIESRYICNMTNQNQLVLPSTIPDDSFHLDESGFLLSYHMQVEAVVLDSHGDHPLTFLSDNTIKREKLSEIYVIDDEHRTSLKKGKGKWTIPEDEEMKSFSQMRYIGAFRNWQKKNNNYISHKGWGLYFPELYIKSVNLLPEVLGKSYNGSKDVKVCEFREHGEHIWHGFPIDYTDHNTERIHDNALVAWLEVKIIKKHDIPKIQQRKKVKTLCV